jgi:CDP-diglyceride synthetase
MAIKTSLEKTLLGFYVVIVLASIALAFTSIYAGEEWSRSMQIMAPVIPFFVSIGVTVLVGTLYRYNIMTWGLEIQNADGTATLAQV